MADTPVRPGAEAIGSFYAAANIVPHFDAMNNFLARRVLERERPEGWRRGFPRRKIRLENVYTAVEAALIEAKRGER